MCTWQPKGCNSIPLAVFLVMTQTLLTAGCQQYRNSETWAYTSTWGMARIPQAGALAPFGLGHLQEDDIVLKGQLCQTKQLKAKGHRVCRARTVECQDAPALRPSMVNLEMRAAVHAAVVLHAKRIIMNARL